MQGDTDHRLANPVASSKALIYHIFDKSCWSVSLHYCCRLDTVRAGWNIRSFLRELSFIPVDFGQYRKSGTYKFAYCLEYPLQVKKNLFLVFPVNFLPRFHVNRWFNSHKMKILYVSMCSLQDAEPLDFGHTKQKNTKVEKKWEKEENKLAKETQTCEETFIALNFYFFFGFVSNITYVAYNLPNFWLTSNYIISRTATTVK